jgi:tetratricopeptide (TPR) repeat protein
LRNPNARAWAELFFKYEIALRTAPDPVDTTAHALQVNESFANATISREEAWDVVLSWLPTRDGSILRALEAVAAKAGHNTLVAEVLERGFRIEGNVDEIIKAFRQVMQSGESALVSATMFARPIVQARNVEGFVRLLAAVEEKVLDGTDERRGQLAAWAGRFFKELREPIRCLDRIGDRPQPWELDLSAQTRFDLGTERSNALRLVGRRVDALAVAEQVAALLSDDEPERKITAELNIAILRRETGDPEGAIELLERLLNRTKGVDRLGILESLAGTYGFTGRHEKALQLLDEASRLARGPYGERAGIIAALRAQMLAAIGEHEKAAAALSEATPAPDAYPDEFLVHGTVSVPCRCGSLGPTKTSCHGTRSPG